jgi:hypothetical protein
VGSSKVRLGLFSCKRNDLSLGSNKFFNNLKAKLGKFRKHIALSLIFNFSKISVDVHAGHQGDKLLSVCSVLGALAPRSRRLLLGL